MAVAPSELWERLARDAEAESTLWAAALRPSSDRELVAVFSPLADERFAFGLETVYEGYLAHYGRPRLFSAASADEALLLGDYLYAHGLVRVASHGEPAAVGNLAELLALCAQLRGDGASGDGGAAFRHGRTARRGAGRAQGRRRRRAARTVGRRGGRRDTRRARPRSPQRASGLTSRRP